MIKPPTCQIPDKIKDNFRWYPFFKVSSHALLYHTISPLTVMYSHNHVFFYYTERIALAIDSTQSAAYRGRKHYISQNVLPVVDFDLRFTYVLSS
jgi:hypothetical protein